MCVCEVCNNFDNYWGPCYCSKKKAISSSTFPLFWWLKLLITKGLCFKPGFARHSHKYRAIIVTCVGKMRQSPFMSLNFVSPSEKFTSFWMLMCLFWCFYPDEESFDSSFFFSMQLVLLACPASLSLYLQPYLLYTVSLNIAPEGISVHETHVPNNVLSNKVLLLLSKVREREREKLKTQNRHSCHVLKEPTKDKKKGLEYAFNFSVVSSEGKSNTTNRWAS